MLLQKQTHALGWAAAASADVVRNITGAVRTGGRSLIALPGRSAPIDALELLGLAL
jgi:hypothetical protein